MWFENSLAMCVLAGIANRKKYTSPFFGWAGFSNVFRLNGLRCVNTSLAGQCVTGIAKKQFARQHALEAGDASVISFQKQRDDKENKEIPLYIFQHEGSVPRD
mmetsp:Transcript_78845/g.211698  ORF Transcript_78845/g.211698 Transcript_78845/m.211698 type:complete len:103 (+) Transcript_78845:556-864(+)